MTAISDELETEFSNAPTYLADLTQVVDLTDLSKKFSMEVIASCAFGVKAESFVTNYGDTTPFIKNTYDIFTNTSIDNLRISAVPIPISNYRKLITVVVSTSTVWSILVG